MTRAAPSVLALIVALGGVGWACAEEGRGGLAPPMLILEGVMDGSGEPRLRAPLWSMGEVSVASPRQVSLTVRNLGATVATVHAIEVTGEGFALASGAAVLPARVDPGRTLSAVMRVAPEAPCRVTGSVRVRAAGERPPLIVGLEALGRSLGGDAEGLAGSVETPPGAGTFRTLRSGDTVVFGAVPLGHLIHRTVVLSWAGPCPLELLDVSIEPHDAGFDVAVDPTGVSVPPGGELALQVRLHPDAPGDAVARLDLGTSAGAWSVNLRGSGGVPQLAFERDVGSGWARLGAEGLDLGAVEVGATGSALVKVVDVSGAPSEVTGVAVVGDGLRSGWSLGEARLRLPMGGSFEVPVTLAPTAPGAVNGALRVSLGGLTAELPLRGTGVAGVPRLLVADPAEAGGFVPISGPQGLDFGVAEPGDRVARRVRLANAGDGALIATQVEVGLGFEATLSTPALLSPGTSVDFDVAFRPIASVTTYDQELVVRTNRGVGATALRGALARECGLAAAATEAQEVPCAPSAEVLCLGDGRFAVTAAYQTLSCDTGAGQVAAAGERSGVLAFGDEEAWRVLVSLDDACAAGGSMTLRAASVTRSRIDLKVVDTVTGTVAAWTNPLGERLSLPVEAVTFPCP